MLARGDGGRVTTTACRRLSRIPKTWNLMQRIAAGSDLNWRPSGYENGVS